MTAVEQGVGTESESEAFCVGKCASGTWQVCTGMLRVSA